MTYTYRGTKVEREWMPLAMANGVEDGNDETMGAWHRKYNPLYRRGIANRVLYRIGWWLGRRFGMGLA